MMSSFFSLFVSFQVVAAAAVVGLVLALAFFRKLSSSAELRLHYGCLALVFALPLILLLRPAPRLFEPVLKVWSAPPKSSAVHFAPEKTQGIVRVGPSVSVNADYLFLFVLGICAGSVLMGAGDLFARATASSPCFTAGLRPQAHRASQSLD